MKKKIIVNLLVVFLYLPCTYSQFAKLFDFTRTIDIQHSFFSQFVSDGTWLYATSNDGGAKNDGALFRIKPDGTGYSKLMDFDSLVNGAHPYGALAISGNTLYGTTSVGGEHGDGTLFKINTDGTGYIKLADFLASTKGSVPNGSLAIANNVLYGMTSEGGANSQGCIFKVNTDGTDFVKLFDFSGFSDGANPYGSVIIAGNTLYGMTFTGGEYNSGSLFRIHTDGTGFSRLIDFKGAANGAYPYGSLVISDNVLYGMTSSGGAHKKGCLFKINTDSTGYADLLDFNGTNGGNPTGSLSISGNALFGMAYTAGNGNEGIIFKIGTDGQGYTKLSDLGLGSTPTGTPFMLNNVLFGMTDSGGSEQLGSAFRINMDGTGYANLLNFGLPGNGAKPQGLTIVDNVAYGTTYSGGAFDAGCIFKINTDGTGYVKVFDFNDTLNGATNGFYPTGSPVVWQSYIYGTTSYGGTYNSGCIYKIKTDGTAFTTLYSFNSSNNDGYSPFGTLVLSGNVLYGTTFSGGSFGFGTIYKINTDGTGYARLFNFNQANGANPTEGLQLAGDSLYGATPFGGTGIGSVFKININGTGFTNLHNFNSVTDSPYIPFSSPALIGNTLFGTTSELGNIDQGAIYKINTDGTGFDILKRFVASDGTPPIRSLIAVGNSLYGTAGNGGASNAGTIFKFNTTSNEFTKIWDFTPRNGSGPSGTLAYSGGKLYGGTYGGGTSNNGVLFSLVLATNPKTDPVISWNNPSDISYGILLGTTQLNATANVPGTFVYTPSSGTKLEIGNSQNLRADFTPTDTGSYNRISKTVSINVNQTTGFGNINDDDDIKIYPNPFEDYIIVESAKSYASVSILELSGKLVSRIATNGQLKNTIPVQNLEAGSYLIVLKDGDNNILLTKHLEKLNKAYHKR